MRRLAILLLLLPASAAPRAEETVRGEIGAKLDAYVKGLDLCGSVLVAKNGEILLNKGYGVMDEKGTPMRADAMWDWASASKQFTAAAILKLEMLKKSPSTTRSGSTGRTRRRTSSRSRSGTS